MPSTSSGLLKRPLAEMSNLVKPVSLAGEQTLTLAEPLASLFPGGLRRGSIVSVDSPALTTALMASLSSSGHWCAVVNSFEFFFGSVKSFGGDLAKCCSVSSPGDQLVATIAALVDACDVVVCSQTASLTFRDARRLVARAKERGSVLFISEGSAWNGLVSLNCRVKGRRFDGIDKGHGLLSARYVELEISGKGAAARPTTKQLWLPNKDGQIEIVESQADIQRRSQPLKAVS